MRVRVICVAALTVGAFLLRVRGLHEGLWHDELITFAELHDRSFTGMLDAVANGPAPGAPVENTPPLHFALAWLTMQLGEPTATIRLPSIVLGTATVPVVYAFGRRTVGTAAALVGAGFIALSPFAIFYGIDARAYGVLMFFAALSAWVLLVALERDSPRWWVAYGLAVAAVIYTHYTGAIVLATEVAWALWVRRDLWRPLLLAVAGAAVLFVPWLPFVNSSTPAFDRVAALLGIDDRQALLQWVAGMPDVLPRNLPGVTALVLLGAGAALGLAGAVAGRAAPWRSREVMLVLLLALTTPLVLVLRNVFGADLLVYARNMSAALPFLGVLLGWLVTRPPRPVALAAVGLVAVGIGIGAAKTLEDRYHRPNSPGVAAALDARLGAGGTVVYYGPGLEPFVLTELLSHYYEEPHGKGGAIPQPGSLRRALDRAGRGRPEVPVVQFDHGDVRRLAAGWDLLGQRGYSGTGTIVVSWFAPLEGARYRNLAPAPGPVDGALDNAVERDDVLELSGWALARGRRPVDHVLAYVGSRLVGAGLVNSQREDVARAQHLSDDRVGFVLQLPALSRAERAKVRVVGTDGRQASQLDRYCSAQVRDLLGC